MPVVHKMFCGPTVINLFLSLFVLMTVNNINVKASSHLPDVAMNNSSPSSSPQPVYLRINYILILLWLWCMESHLYLPTKY